MAHYSADTGVEIPTATEDDLLVRDADVDFLCEANFLCGSKPADDGGGAPGTPLAVEVDAWALPFREPPPARARVDVRSRDVRDRLAEISRAFEAEKRERARELLRELDGWYGARVAAAELRATRARLERERARGARARPLPAWRRALGSA